MFSLWYMVLGAKEYRQPWSVKCPPSPGPVPQVVKPDVIPKKASDPIVINKPQVTTPDSLITATPTMPTVAPVKPPRPDVPQSSSENQPVAPLNPQSITQQNRKPSPPVPEPPIVPPMKQPQSPGAQKSVEPPKPAVFTKSREDELLGRTEKSEPKPQIFPSELSYSSNVESGRNQVLNEHSIISNPDSLESSEAEDD